MNSEFLTLNLPDLETLISKSNCACHIINPHKTRILMWKKVKDDQVTYYLRIGIQKFTSQAQVDRNGEIYWRYWTYEPKDELEVNKEIPTDPHPITKTEALNNHGDNPNSN